MNDLQLYEYYISMPLNKIGFKGKLYPKYVVITGFCTFPPNPHRHYSLIEFISKLEEDNEFKNFLESKNR